MVVGRTAWAVLFSLAVHGMIFGGTILISGHERTVSERVYRVALADFVAPPVPQAAPPGQPENLPEPVPPVPEPAPEPAPEPEPVPEPEPIQRKVKNISANKEKKKAEKPPAQKPAPRPPAPAFSAPVAESGPVARNVGGFSVYESERVDTRPAITKRAVPEYPHKARRMNVEGSVLVQVVVDRRGMPQNPSILKAAPTGYFEEAALRAVQRMRFTPGRLKGQPVNTLVNIPFTFKLR